MHLSHFAGHALLALFDILSFIVEDKVIISGCKKRAMTVYIFGFLLFLVVQLAVSNVKTAALRARRVK